MSSDKSVAVITGAASGIGFALAEACIKRGFRLVLADNNAQGLHDSALYFKKNYQEDVFTEVCDVRSSESLCRLAKNTVEQFGRVDWLFNNAGISGVLAPIWEMDPQEIHKVLEVNLFGVIYGVQAFLPYMFAQPHRSRIINVASLYGLCSGSQMGAYSMSKHAVVALSESLYFDLTRLEKPVDVSVACPSFVSTQLLSNPQAAPNNSLHTMLNDLIARSRPAPDIAEYIVLSILANKFYILPDKEVKSYCDERNTAILQEGQPHLHSIEKIVSRLSKRASQTQSLAGKKSV